jgi:hypothetical protein
MKTHKVSIGGEIFDLKIDSVCESAKDGKSGIYFITSKTQKKFFVPFDKFSFLINNK